MHIHKYKFKKKIFLTENTSKEFLRTPKNVLCCVQVQIYLTHICHVSFTSKAALWPLLLTWFNFNPSMDK